MGGRVVAITGCTTGIAYNVALQLASLGASIMMLNRPSERATAAQAKVKAAARRKDQVIRQVDCDFTSLASVRAGCQKMQDFVSQIDILFLSAGLHAFTPQSNTQDGFDVQIQVGYLAQMLVLHECFPMLDRASGRKAAMPECFPDTDARRPEARVIFGSSGGRFQMKDKEFPESTYQPYVEWEPPFSSSDARYGLRMALMQVASVEFSKRASNMGGNLKSVCSVPGLVATNVHTKGYDHPGAKNNINNCFLASYRMAVSSSGMSEADGAMTPVYCATSKEIVTGELYAANGSFPLNSGREQNRGMPEKSVPAEWEAAMLAQGAGVWKKTFSALGDANFLDRGDSYANYA